MQNAAPEICMLHSTPGRNENRRVTHLPGAMLSEELRCHMQLIKNRLARFPRVKSQLQSLYDLFQGLPPLSNSAISKELIREFVGRSDPVILDIGCNDGKHTAWFLEVFESPRIFSFEPDPRAAARFRAKIGQASNVELFEIALSDRNGDVTFYQSAGHRNEKQADKMPEGWDLSGSIRKPKEHLVVHPWIKFDRTITVKTAMLDAWCDEHAIEVIDFIWMDVQGAELDVLRGGTEALSKTRFIYTEYNNRELYEGQSGLRDLLKHLKGFEVVARYPRDVLLRNKGFDPVRNKARP